MNERLILPQALGGMAAELADDIYLTRTVKFGSFHHGGDLFAPYQLNLPQDDTDFVEFAAGPMAALAQEIAQQTGSGHIIGITGETDVLAELMVVEAEGLNLLRYPGKSARRSAARRGEPKRLVGGYEPGDTGILVNDFLLDTTQVESTARALGHYYQLPITHILAVVDVEYTRQRDPFTLCALVTFDDLLRHYLDAGLITSETAEASARWARGYGIPRARERRGLHLLPGGNDSSTDADA